MMAFATAHTARRRQPACWRIGRTVGRVRQGHCHRSITLAHHFCVIAVVLGLMLGVAGCSLGNSDSDYLVDQLPLGPGWELVSVVNNDDGTSETVALFMRTSPSSYDPAQQLNALASRLRSVGNPTTTILDGCGEDAEWFDCKIVSSTPRGELWVSANPNRPGELVAGLRP